MEANNSACGMDAIGDKSDENTLHEGDDQTE